MYRLMIADDEDDERRGIRFLIQKFGFEFDIIEAVDGKDALKKLQENHIDILFTDVRMPFLNGLELSGKAKDLVPGIQFIFFSGYDDFEYVKQALSLQAVDYILKPVNPSEFEKVIKTVVERLDSRADMQRQNQELYRGYVLSRLLNKVPFEKIQNQFSREKLSFLSDYRRIILMEFEEEFFGTAVPDIQELEVCLRKNADADYDFLDLNPFQGIFLVKRKGEDIGYCRDLAEKLHSIIEAEYHVKSYLSISPEISNVWEVGDCCETAESYLESRFFYKDVYVYPMDKGWGEEEGSSEKEEEILQSLRRDIECRDVYSVRQNMEILLEKCRNNCFQSYIYTRFICANLLKVLFQGLPGEEYRLAPMVEELYRCGRFTDVEKILYQVLEALEEKLLPQQNSPKYVIAVVEQYIREHFKEVLSLDILADRVYLTPHYLSSIFSQEKGIGINKYIKNIRMEKARELLKNTNMKVNDICRDVGYSNLSYFCKTFRNEYGVTPEKYRER